MKESLWGYLLISLGIVIIVVLFLVYNYSSANENDYYVLKEATEAAVIESIDYGEWGKGKLKINSEVFIESFLRRFASTTNTTKNYKIEFKDIYEEPVKVSVIITTSTGDHTVNRNTADIPVVNILDGILEMRKPE